ncbi:MFS transporter [Cellulophaga sp. BC115SP]|uniref:MFS transporter n=1 Tax=Cellulophaga sp. BC115SP TaxID=2683263 RepID=UPI0014134F1D|nr:MFS transporter [Cellulophaga sp. BC115SP]NBB29766.1 MFS transporter [Cellulophaga sp. BC115SP]
MSHLTLNQPAKMTSLQYSSILVCFLMNMLDGMDVMVISYAAPAITKAWNIGAEALGLVFSSGLVGMSVGALMIAPYADRFGRKKMMIISGLLMGVTIFITSFAGSINQLIFFRFINGLGIGCMLASTAALTSEYAPSKTKDFWVSFALSGYPIGAVLSGIVAAKIIPTYGWHSIFQLAGCCTLASVPVVYFFLAESLEFYLKSQPLGALEKANDLLVKMGRESISTLPEKPQVHQKVPIKLLLSQEFRISTFQLWIALFLSFATLYFLTSWIPKLASTAGLSIELAIYAGTVFNLGAFVGIITQGYFSSKYGLKKTIGTILVLTAILMAIFKVFVGTDWILLVFGLLGFGIQGGFVGLYAVSARIYPTEFRTTGVGWSIGIGRLGGIIGPAVGGVLIGLGLSMSTNFLIFAIPTALAGLMTWYLSTDKVS